MILKFFNNIVNNGMYWTITSFMLIMLDLMIHPVGYYVIERLLFCIVATLFILSILLDYQLLKFSQIVYISRTEILIALGLLTAEYIKVFVIDTQLSITITNILSIIVLVSGAVNYYYRIRNYYKIDEISIPLKYEKIRKFLKLEKNLIFVKVYKEKNISYIKNKNISYGSEIFFLYKNKKINFEILEEIQMTFNKEIRHFNEAELKVAEMYSIN